VLGWHHRRAHPSRAGGADDGQPQRCHHTARPRVAVDLVHRPAVSQRLRAKAAIDWSVVCLLVRPPWPSDPLAGGHPASARPLRPSRGRPYSAPAGARGAFRARAAQGRRGGAASCSVPRDGGRRVHRRRPRTAVLVQGDQAPRAATHGALLVLAAGGRRQALLLLRAGRRMGARLHQGRHLPTVPLVVSL
jgi:hypothetical protein